MKIQEITKPGEKLPFKIMLSDPASKFAMAPVTNPYSGESCELPRYAVAVYERIKDAEFKEDFKTNPIRFCVEVFAWAMTDHNRAVTWGEITFGKSVAQV